MEIKLFEFLIRPDTNNESVTVTRKDVFNEIKSLKISMSLEEFKKCLISWRKYNMYIQEAFRKLNSDEREFLISGMLPNEFNDLFKGLD